MFRSMCWMDGRLGEVRVEVRVEGRRKYSVE